MADNHDTPRRIRAMCAVRLAWCSFEWNGNGWEFVEVCSQPAA